MKKQTNKNRKPSLAKAKKVTPKNKSKITIECNGGFREVGNNAVILDDGKDRFTMEFGFNVSDGIGPLIPDKDVDAVVICHGHLDHCGSIPELWNAQKKKLKVFGTQATKDLAELVLYDSVKVGKLKDKPRNFGKSDIKSVLNNWKTIGYKKPFKIGDAKITFHDAGHIPGSAMAFIEMAGKKILYTSDFKIEPTQLVNGADYKKFKDLDLLIMETTYSSRALDKRNKIEKAFAEKVKETIKQGGIALIPSFAIRAPELIMILEKYGADFPIYVDGMGRTATEISEKNPKFIRNSVQLKNAMKKTTLVESHEQRKQVTKKPCAIVTTGGSMDGGPVAHYIKYVYADPKSALITAGYQIPGTAGRYLLDTGRYVTEAVDLKVKCPMYNFELSSHAGRDELLQLVKDLRPKKVMCIHGAHCQRFAMELKSQLSIDAIAPKQGAVVEL